MLKTAETCKVFRKIVGDEHKYLWNPLSNVIVVARIIGPVDETGLKNAIRKAKEMHPLVSARAVYDTAGTGWFCCDVDDLPLRVTEWRHEDQWKEEMQFENKVPLKIFEGPLIRFVLIRSEKVSDLMVYCQHAICDGRALVYLIRNILTFMANPEKEAEPLPLPPLLSSEGLAASGLLKGSFKKTLIKSVIKKRNSGWAKRKTDFDQEDFENIHQAYWQKHIYRVETLELTEEQTERLPAVCRQHGVTVTSALTAAFLAAHLDVGGPFAREKRKVALPVDLRSRMREPTGDVFCYYISRILIDYGYNPRESFWTNAKVIHSLVGSAMDKTNLFEAAVMLESMDPTLINAMSSFGALAETVPKGYSRYEKLSAFAADKKNQAVILASRFLNMSPGLVLTNLGKPAIPEVFGEMTVDRMFFAPSTDKRFPMVIGSLTAGGKLVITMNYVDETDKTSNSDRMKKVMLKAYEFIKLMCTPCQGQFGFLTFQSNNY